MKKQTVCDNINRKKTLQENTYQAFFRAFGSRATEVTWT